MLLQKTKIRNVYGMVTKRFLLLIALSLFTSVMFSQTITKKQVDEFTGAKIIETDWEKLVYSMKFTAYCRIRIVDDAHYFQVRLMYGSVYSIPEDASIIFKLKDESTYQMKNRDYVISSRGGGAAGKLAGSEMQGTVCNYTNSGDINFSGLLESFPTKVRIYFRDSYIENDIKEKDAKIIQEMIKLTKDL